MGQVRNLGEEYVRISSFSTLQFISLMAFQSLCDASIDGDIEGSNATTLIDLRPSDSWAWKWWRFVALFVSIMGESLSKQLLWLHAYEQTKLHAEMMS